MSVCAACGYQGEGDGPVHAYMSASSACWARYGEVLARQSLQIHLAALMLRLEDAVAHAAAVARYAPRVFAAWAVHHPVLRTLIEKVMA